MTRATETEIGEFLSKNRLWSLDSGSLVAEFKFKDFNEAMGFVARVALAAEKADHHPDIDIRWNEVRLMLSTHSEGGITSKDFDLGARISAFV